MSSRSYRPFVGFGAPFLVLALVLLLFLGISGSGARFTGAVVNTKNTATTRAFFSCKQAQAATIDAWGAWALGSARTSRGMEPDLTGNNRSALAITGAKTAKADIGCHRDTPAESVNFDGMTTCFIANQKSPATSWPATGFSMEIWFKTTSSTSAGALFDFTASPQKVGAAGTAGTGGPKIYLNSAGKLVFGVHGSHDALTSPRSYRDGTWHHALVVSSATDMALYVDGDRVASGNSNQATPSKGWWHIGCGSVNEGSGEPNAQPSGSGLGHFTGQLQYAAVYTRPLTAAQVLMHYQAGVR